MDLFDHHHYQPDPADDPHQAPLEHGAQDWLDGSHHHAEHLHPPGLEGNHDHYPWPDLFDHDSPYHEHPDPLHPDNPELGSGQHHPLADDYSEHLQHYNHFNPLTDTHDIIGHPAEDMRYWHQQTHPDSCGVATQEFVLAGLTGTDISEKELQTIGKEHEWYLPGLGMPLDHVGKLIETFGHEVQPYSHASLMNLEHELLASHKIIVGVNAESIWRTPQADSQPLNAFPGIPGQSTDHVVEVIGINLSDPAHPMVILNDPGFPEGRGAEIPIDVFSKAWSASDNFMVTTTGKACLTPDLGFFSHLDQIEALLDDHEVGGSAHREEDGTDLDSENNKAIPRY